ncbi:hypothetical protein MXEN_00185 [Mycobacterium xenopi RIVM700367]|nr:hypothetical protein MXEN_00185 [Mycobacterium xenopi RIVM700367]
MVVQRHDASRRPGDDAAEGFQIAIFGSATSLTRSSSFLALQLAYAEYINDTRPRVVGAVVSTASVQAIERKSRWSFRTAPFCPAGAVLRPLGVSAAKQDNVLMRETQRLSSPERR